MKLLYTVGALTVVVVILFTATMGMLAYDIITPTPVAAETEGGDSTPPGLWGKVKGLFSDKFIAIIMTFALAALGGLSVWAKWVTNVLKEIGEFFITYHAAQKDDKFTSEEIRKMREEWGDIVSVVKKTPEKFKPARE
jgi:hypothetical protein